MRRDFVTMNFPAHIVDVLGGVDKCVREYAYFRGTRDVVGGTDYIDQVRLCDLPPGPGGAAKAAVSLAVDPFCRPLAVLRYWCTAAAATSPVPDTDSDDDNAVPPHLTARQYARARIPHEVAVALFQRYTNYPKSWAFGSYYGLYRMPGDSRATDAALARVKHLLQGDTVTVGRNDWLELSLSKPLDTRPPR